jgi:CubicO group peptidase (beta-lactamase class C family)
LACNVGSARKHKSFGSFLQKRTGFLQTICLAAFSSLPAAATAFGPQDRAAVDAIVRQTLAEDQTPSASIAIVLDGRLAYAAAYGLARLSPAETATTATRYQIASISKTLAAQAMLRLEQAGKLSLDDTVSRWLPDLTDATHVSLRELLNHTAGYPDHYPQTYPAGPRSKPTTPDRILAQWGHHKLLFAPGSNFHYSNLNYLIAARIIEKASGQQFFTFLTQQIFTPLGMSDTIDLDQVSNLTPNLATGYVRPALAPLEPAPDEGPGWSFGAGQVVTTARDLARWDAAFLNGSLLPAAQAREETAPPVLANGVASDYALGLEVSHRGGRTIFYHVGQGLGFLAENRIYPAEHDAIVVLTNDSSSLTFRHVADRLAYIVVPPGANDAAARTMFASLQKGKPDRALFTADLSAYFDKKRVADYASSLGPLGPAESFDLHSESEADGLTTRIYDIVAGNRRLRLVQQTEPDGRMESFQVQPAVN